MRSGDYFEDDDMCYPWYMITGDVTVENFTNLWTGDRAFIWRGYTHDYEMIPSAANYNEHGEQVTNYRKESCHPLGEIRRFSEKIYALNKLQKFPFEISAFIKKVLFAPFYQPEEKIFKEIGVEYFPDNSLAQSMAIVQHEFGGTSLLDFSTNKYKALYFAIGRNETMNKDSYIFGLNVPYFETYKNNFTKEIFTNIGKKFDILYPSYFMNDKIANQEGVFLYQKFEIDKLGNIHGGGQYENIVDYFKGHFEDTKNKHHNLFQEISIDDFLQKAEQEGNLDIFYILLKVPSKEKKKLKRLLDAMGITDNFMTNVVNTEKYKTEYCFNNGDGI
jgi:hypothetical protein